MTDFFPCRVCETKRFLTVGLCWPCVQHLIEYVRAAYILKGGGESLDEFVEWVKKDQP